jgi:hypothetical protein
MYSNVSTLRSVFTLYRSKYEKVIYMYAYTNRCAYSRYIVELKKNILCERRGRGRSERLKEMAGYLLYFDNF